MTSTVSHHVVPYMQIQSDWNIVADSVRMYGMLNKIPISNIPKEFHSKGSGGDEIVIKVCLPQILRC